MLDKKVAKALFLEGAKIHEIAQKFGTSKAAVYMALYREGVRVSRGSKCREAASYSKTHTVRETSEKFEIKKEAIYHYRRVYRNEIQEALQLKGESK